MTRERQESRRKRRREYEAEYSLRRGAPLHPPLSLGLHHVARTCLNCGDLVTTPDHRLRMDSGQAWDCPRCRREAERPYQREARRTQPNAIAAHLDSSQKTQARRQSETVDGARQHGKQWTGPEFEIAARAELSTAEVAKMLGRTFFAVKAARSKLSHEDPKTMWLLGAESRD